MTQEGFFGLVGHQLRSDLASAPATARRWLSEGGRAERCLNIAELRALARRRIPRAVFDYVDGAAGDELTKARNEADLRGIAVIPRMLAGLTEVDLSTTVLGQRIEVPLLGAPTGTTGLVHHEGEVGIARAVHSAGGVYVLSSSGSRGIGELAQLCPGPRWFQLYVARDHDLARQLVELASEHGYSALVVTVDVQRSGRRERDLRNGFTVPPRVTARSLAQGLRQPRWSFNFVRRPRILSEAALTAARTEAQAVSLVERINRQFDPALSWNDIAWLQEQWSGPILIKGLLRVDDARQAARMGLAGVIVSNHGGRQLDQAPSSISALPGIVDAVGTELEVYMDGGIRRGVDVVKALALGARACLLGRALVYGLGAGGEAGARHAMSLMVDELRLAMTLAGCGSVRELDRSWLRMTPEAERSAAWSTS